jgi:hypothetical protein
MNAEGSVSLWLHQLKAGDPDAAQKLWDRYFRRLAGLARLKLRGTSRPAANEEDLALSAFASFCRGVERGRFPHLLHDYARGRRHPGFAPAAKIARALEVSCDVFVDCEDVAGPVKTVPKQPRSRPRKGK